MFPRYRLWPFASSSSGKDAELNIAITALSRSAAKAALPPHTAGGSGTGHREERRRILLLASGDDPQELSRNGRCHFRAESVQVVSRTWSSAGSYPQALK